MKRLRAVSFAAAVAALSGWVVYDLNQAYQGFAEPKVIEVERGTATRRLAAQLEREGVIRRSWHLLVLRVLDQRAVLQAGEYRFDRPLSPRDVFNRIVRGDVVSYEIRVPEGSNLFDIARIASGTGIFTEREFLKAARDPSLIRDIAPEARSLEGYLFPATYQITRRTTAAGLCELMTKEFRARWRELGAPPPAHPIVTMASLVEKETGDPDERPLIASVLRNRLDRGIRLECDPTTIYAALLESRFDGIIHRSDLNSKHPYNTYQHTGLPPGPIANPGVESLRAALTPAQSEFLFFVAKPGVRGHQFSTTLREHEQAVAAYRNAQRKQKARVANGVAR